MELLGKVLTEINTGLKHLVLGDMCINGVNYCVVRISEDLTRVDEKAVFDLIEVRTVSDGFNIRPFSGTEEEKQKLANEIMALP
jgi:hypothetical protein